MRLHLKGKVETELKVFLVNKEWIIQALFPFPPWQKFVWVDIFFYQKKKTLDILPVPNFNWLLRAWQKAGTISIETESSNWEKIN